MVEETTAGASSADKRRGKAAPVSIPLKPMADATKNADRNFPILVKLSNGRWSLRYWVLGVRDWVQVYEDGSDEAVGYIDLPEVTGPAVLTEERE